ncbi:hypothetical protein HK100_007601, partial [Physocladia obscura]
MPITATDISTPFGLSTAGLMPMPEELDKCDYSGHGTACFDSTSNSCHWLHYASGACTTTSTLQSPAAKIGLRGPGGVNILESPVLSPSPLLMYEFTDMADNGTYSGGAHKPNSTSIITTTATTHSVEIQSSSAPSVKEDYKIAADSKPSSSIQRQKSLKCSWEGCGK